MTEPIAEPKPASAPEDPPVTLSVTRRVRPGREREFEEFLRGLTETTSKFPGYLGTQIFRPPRGEREFRVVFSFDRESNLHAWKESEERRAWNAIGDELAEEPPRYANITGTAQEQRLALALTPLQGFVQTSVSGIGLLLLGTILALIAANSPLAGAYEHFWEAELTIGTEAFGISESLRHWVNDCLMALFFFIVGLEIKREVLVGEMRVPRLAALPIAAAVGGAVVPAAIFALLNRGGPGATGWGIPMATDTAFALGMITLFGGRVRPLLLVFLTAFSIVDDIIAVLVIAVFYTEAIDWTALGLAALLLGGLLLANRAGFHRWPVYAFGGIAVWLAVFESGVHGTAAGVLVALVVPARSWINPSEFLVRARHAIEEFERACYLAPSILTNEPQQRASQTLERLCEEVETPMTYFQHRLNPWVAYAILPVFAFANAGIPLLEGLGEALSSQVAWGVVAGLVLGKPIGIALFAWLAVRVGIAILPGAITWPHVLGIALLGGIGFTISLFVTELAFEAGAVANEARVGILLGSVVAGALGYVVLGATLPPSLEPETD
ncbi:MAG TPA: Na+/H+ antiporter NhaA [Thermomicrobiales bacterium]|nr:Na+/H+ antiporter NhaA [Thermomicrobiales bacterium]